jgi:hypothetical protein
MRYFFMLALITLTGCAMSPEQRAQDAINTYGPDCEKKGYSSNSDDWRRCIQAGQIAAQNWRMQEADIVHRRGIYCMDPTMPRAGRC